MASQENESVKGSNFDATKKVNSLQADIQQLNSDKQA